MAKSAFVRARIEPELKENAEHILNELGIRPSDAINMFYHQIERTGGLPFHATLRVSLELEEDMKRLDQINNGEYIENSDVVAWLRSIGTEKEIACPVISLTTRTITDEYHA